MKDHPSKVEVTNTSKNKPFIEVIDTQHDTNEYIEYNKNINNHPEYLNKFIVRDNHVIVRLFKYEEFAVSDGGIIIDNATEFMTDSTGQIKARRDANPYQFRGVIVNVGHLGTDNPFLSKLVPGTVVRTLSNKLGNEFDTEPTTKGTQDNGYFLIHVGQICGIEQW
jgi:hypothetical protein